MSRETSMTSTARPKRMKRKTLYIIATTACIAAYAALVLLSHIQAWLIWPALALALLSVVLACLWMVALDEAAQQAHYISWFWGGSAGLLFSMLILVAVVLRPEAFHAFMAEIGPSYSFAAGIMAGLLPPTIGYVIWWIMLWLRRG
jgi:uncharacterized membrane protein YfcA